MTGRRFRTRTGAAASGRLVEMADPRVALIERCADIDRAALGEGAFSPGPALWVGRREVAHLDGPGHLDVRLTRSAIRERRAELRGRTCVELRPGTSDWVRVQLRSEADYETAFELVRDAVTANAATAEPGPPPTGTELARRRRFH